MYEASSREHIGGSPPSDKHQLQALARIARAVAQPADPVLCQRLVDEVARSLETPMVFMAVSTGASPDAMRAMAVHRHGEVGLPFDLVLGPGDAGSSHGPLHIEMVGAADPAPIDHLVFHVAAALKDAQGTPRGWLVAMDRRPVAHGDLDHAQEVLDIVAGRLSHEIERSHADEALRSAALEVASARSDSVFEQMVRLLTSLLQVEMACLARLTPEAPHSLQVLAMERDGQLLHDALRHVPGTACEAVLGKAFQIHTHDLPSRFPNDVELRAQCFESYAGFPLTASDGTPLGVLSVASRRALTDVERIESVLKVFAVRATAELERLHASEALRRSEASYRAIFETAEDSIFIHDWDTGEILDVNPKACETYGYSREELRRLTVADISAGQPPYTRDHALHWIHLAKLGRCPPFEWRRRNKDGSLHWDEVRLKSAMIDGQPHILAFTRDITEHKLALAALQAREEQYRAIFDESTDCLGLWDRNGRLVDVNQAFTRIRGYTREEVLGRTLTDRRNEPSAPQRQALIEGALAGHNGRIEVQLPYLHGGTMDLEIRYVPVTFGGERYALSVARDVTASRERERALVRSEARLRATVEAAFDCVIGMDGEGRIVEFNAAAERCFGRRREDVLGRLLADVIIPERHRDAHARGLKHFHVSGRGPMVGRLVETTALRADGEEMPVELAISVAAVPEGSIFVGHLRDISARRAAETERLALEAQLRQAQKMEAIGQLTGGIAHDFNNILTSVIGYLVLGQERAETLQDATLVRQLGQAHLAAQRARDLIAQMLTFARRQKGERRALALAPLVRQTLELLRSTLPSSVSLVSDSVHASHDASAPWVMADPVQLEQVLFNLCINARDAMEGNGHMQVGLRAAPSQAWHCASCQARVPGGGPWVDLHVSDSGPGVEPELLERIFDPFFSTKPPGQGSGMGLAMVHGIVHDHGGHVMVRRREGGGSVFSVMLPLTSPSLAVLPAVPGQLAAPAQRPLLSGRVLLVEDDAMVGDYLVEQLQSWGLHVELQCDPAKARAWLEDPAKQMDLLITDQTMPGLTGLQLAEVAHRQRPGLPVLLVSGNAGGFDADELARLGVCAALAKPLVAESLLAQVRDALAPNAN
ncbi:PAS domain S-box protein [Hydrogenophaga sp.]|uniref:PAS domain-containing hybrid sensor histidine kinase/response regulator n=1 Tax=Hydrogenophaga sp. TaxID=1904254 RepID=UPI002726A7A8|nr:PAS domain S-box protein [Hydrogenophaga sp.]MDO8905601.1 PAS domain S-box protein [Hydrogenophaga sp.]